MMLHSDHDQVEEENDNEVAETMKWTRGQMM